MKFVTEAHTTNAKNFSVHMPISSIALLFNYGISFCKQVHSNNYEYKYYFLPEPRFVHLLKSIISIYG
ncbi:MAG: hypothetical protein EU533_06280 [Promethearchaeota archaeon]|nr:MAG: hypothetical protein EU533_06280 [Candidatus Lokiarchaeota archaeon]